MGRQNPPRDPNGAHARIYHSLLNSTAWRCLNGSSKALFVDLRASLTGTNNGNISAALTLLKHRGWSSSGTLARAVYELRSLKFLVVTQEGGLKQKTRKPTLYAFTDLEVFERKGLIPAQKASHGYLEFKTVAEAQRALKDGVEALQAAGRAKQITKKVPVRKQHRISAETALEPAFSSAEIEQGDGVPVLNSNRGNLALVARRPA